MCSGQDLFVCNIRPAQVPTDRRFQGRRQTELRQTSSRRVVCLLALLPSELTFLRQLDKNISLTPSPRETSAIDRFNGGSSIFSNAALRSGECAGNVGNGQHQMIQAFDHAQSRSSKWKRGSEKCQRMAARRISSTVSMATPVSNQCGVSSARSPINTRAPAMQAVA